MEEEVPAHWVEVFEDELADAKKAISVLAKFHPSFERNFELEIAIYNLGWLVNRVEAGVMFSKLKNQTSKARLGLLDKYFMTQKNIEPPPSKLPNWLKILFGHK